MRTRVLTGAAAMAVALAAILAASPIPAAVLVGLLCVVGALEVGKLTRLVPWACLATVAMILVLLVSVSPSPAAVIFTLGAFWVSGGAALLIWRPNKLRTATWLVAWVGCGAGSGMVLQLQSLGPGSLFEPNLLLFVLVPLWVGDSVAYFVGRAWGRHKLAPTISPNKTVEGAVANLVGCVVAAYALGVWLGVPTVASVAVGLSAGVFGQAGDLLQSMLKRSAGVKDSGTLLPGHGGVLDRMDSFLFSSYPSMMFLLWLAPELFHVKQWPF